MNYSFGNAQHIGARSSQQDAFGFSNPFEAEFVAHAGLLAVLADGMGGLAHGDLASRAALAAFLAAYRAKTPAESVRDALKRSLAAAKHSVQRERRSVPRETITQGSRAYLEPQGTSNA